MGDKNQVFLHPQKKADVINFFQKAKDVSKIINNLQKQEFSALNYTSSGSIISWLCHHVIIVFHTNWNWFQKRKVFLVKIIIFKFKQKFTVWKTFFWYLRKPLKKLVWRYKWATGPDFTEKAGCSDRKTHSGFNKNSAALLSNAP